MFDGFTLASAMRGPRRFATPRSSPIPLSPERIERNAATRRRLTRFAAWHLDPSAVRSHRACRPELTSDHRLEGSATRPSGAVMLRVSCPLTTIRRTWQSRCARSSVGTTGDSHDRKYGAFATSVRRLAIRPRSRHHRAAVGRSICSCSAGQIQWTFRWFTHSRSR